MPEPRVVIAAGTDACSGGIWTGPEVLGGVDRCCRSTSTYPAIRPVRSRSCTRCCWPRAACPRWHRRTGTGARRERARGVDDRGLAVGLAAGAALSIPRRSGATRFGVGVAVAGSLALAAAGIVAVFAEQLVWQPFSWFALGRGGVHVDQLAGLFLILTGLVSAPLFLAAGSRGPRAARRAAPAARAVRRRRDRRRQRVRVPDRVRAHRRRDLRADLRALPGSARARARRR